MEYLGKGVDDMEGLMGLVIEILKVEAGLAENPVSALEDFLQVIKEELAKSGLSNEELFGGLDPVRNPGLFSTVYLEQAQEAPTYSEAVN
jgi:hypothetical protein